MSKATSKFKLINSGSITAIHNFAQDILSGFSATQKYIPCNYFYDKKGSLIFEEITKLKEYYPTLTEASILNTSVMAMLDKCGNPKVLAELGSGSSSKTKIILSQMLKSSSVHYLPIDISSNMLQRSSLALLDQFENLKVTALSADYVEGVNLLKNQQNEPKLLIWLGSSIGNLTPVEATIFLKDLKKGLSKNDHVLIGIDLVKDKQVLERAYNDSLGVTARFNTNLLERINSELKGDINLNKFEHLAFFNTVESRIEMHLKSLTKQRVTLKSIDKSFDFAEGETIHTENSYKYTLSAIDDLAKNSNYDLIAQYVDDKQFFSLNLLKLN